MSSKISSVQAQLELKFGFGEVLMTKSRKQVGAVCIMLLSVILVDETIPKRFQCLVEDNLISKKDKHCESADNINISLEHIC